MLKNQIAEARQRLQELEAIMEQIPPQYRHLEWELDGKFIALNHGDMRHVYLVQDLAKNMPIIIENYEACLAFNEAIKESINIYWDKAWVKGRVAFVATVWWVENFLDIVRDLNFQSMSMNDDESCVTLIDAESVKKFIERVAAL